MRGTASSIRQLVTGFGVMTVALSCDQFLVDDASLDDTPPTFTGVAFSPDTIDISAGSQPVQVDIRARDDSGIDSLTILVASPNDRNQAECLANTLSGGSAQEGEWRCQLMLETGWEIGAWSVQAISVFDAAGNALALTKTELLDAGYAPRFEVVAPSAEADLSLTKVGSPDSVFVEELVQYVLTAGNNGPSTATGVTVVDTIPGNATPGSVSPSQGSCGLNGVVVTCDLGVVAMGDTATITLNVSPTGAGILTNTAHVTSDLPDGNLENNAATASTQVNPILPTDLVITLTTQPDPVRAGDNLTHDINVSNPGPGDVTDLTIQLAIDGAVLLVTTPAACTTATQANPPLTSLSCVIASLGSGQTSTLSAVVSAVIPGDTLTSTATIETWTGPADPNSTNNTASHVTAVSRLVAWTNASGGTWSDPGNWSSGSVPTVSDSVEIALGGNYSVTLDTDASVGNMVLGGTSGTQRFVIGAQTLTVDSLLIVQDSGLLELSGGVLTGTGNVSIASAMEWTAGAMEGTGTTLVENGAQLNISGTATKSLDTRTVDVAGTALWTDGTISAGNASFNILGTGVFDVRSDDLFEWTSGQSRPEVNITGSLVRAGNAGVASFTTRVNNNGTVDIQTGTLLLGGNSDGTSGGSFTLSLGARLDFSGNAVHTLAMGSSVTGPGDVYVTGGNVSVAGSYNIAGNTDVSSGNISFDAPGGAVTARATIGGGLVTGAGSLTVGTALFWTGGSATLQGQLRLPTGAVAALNTPGTKSLGGGGMWIAGNLQWSEGILNVNDGVIDIQPTGVFNIFGDVSIRDASSVTAMPELRNSGLVIRGVTGSSLPTDSATVEIAVTNTGVIDVEQNGTLTLKGDFAHADQAVVQGRGTMDLQAANVVAFDGDVTPGTSAMVGTLRLLGAFSPTASSTVNIKLGGTAAGTEYDQLDISGQAILDGQLSVTLVTGFTPAEADTFTVLRYGSRLGTFASTTGLDLGGGLTLQPAYTDTALYLIAQIPPPPPLVLTGTMLFSSNRDGTLDIYAKDLTTGVVTQLTNSVLTESFPSWSPDGSRIALTRNNNVWVMDADGSSLVQLTTTGTAGAPSWSPDGAEIVYQERSDGDWDIWTLEVANPTNTRVITNTTQSDQFPRFSPDGSRIVFTRDQGSIVVVDADGSNQTTLRVATVRYPTWSPDGTQIAFSEAAAGEWQIMTLRLTDMTVQQITTEPAFHWYPEWSPDGSVLMFSKNALIPDFFTDVFGLWAMRSDGTGTQVLVEASAADDFNTSWRP